jgi:hypothetical protein
LLENLQKIVIKSSLKNYNEKEEPLIHFFDKLNFKTTFFSNSNIAVSTLFYKAGDVLP